jgi:hypothetical protein
MKPKVLKLHVEGRTPGPRGKAPMVTLAAKVANFNLTALTMKLFI